MTNPAKSLPFVNDGGPLIVLPHEIAHYWEGGDPPRDGRIVQAVFRWNGDVATDYDRACDVEELAQIIDVGPGWGLVLGDEVPHVMWMEPPGKDDFFIVNGLYANDDSDEEVQEVYQGIAENGWKKVGSGLPVEDGRLILMHAASSLTDTDLKLYSVQDSALQTSSSDFVIIGCALVYAAKPGRYEIDVCEVEIEDEAHYIFLRFRHTGHLSVL